jgi:hypothetical protein
MTRASRREGAAVALVKRYFPAAVEVGAPVLGVAVGHGSTVA